MKTKYLPLILTAMLSSGIASAGMKYDSPLFIDLEYRMAGGSLPAVRNSSDFYSALECTITVRTTGTVGNCYAQTAQATYKCETTSPQFLEAIRSISDNSFISFGWDSNNNCTMLFVKKSSTIGPTQP
ncbi:hypothetical protein SAMN05444354_12319 [Stigmatella aurantiaca]|uniref:Uncharacterized protein n=2 Tax=Stigmatella aurantiaca TaxID=41 RepID=A0A1H8B9V2_STIAU|nr:hypothetical protein SAMN05444354_12319 [Stigmatella aurantiaca]